MRGGGLTAECGPFDRGVSQSDGEFGEWQKLVECPDRACIDCGRMRTTGNMRAPKSSWGWGRKAKHLDQFNSAAHQHGYQFFP